MQYLGGKHFLGKAISDVMLSQTRERGRYVEPFVGAGGVLIHMAPHFRVSLASDYSLDLIMLWRALQDGWDPPRELSKEEWDSLRYAEPSALRAFAGFGCSFGAMWFSTYAKPDTRLPGSSYAQSSHNSLLRKIDKLSNSRVAFRRRSYQNITVKPGDVVYLDPPYEGTTGYEAAPEFDHDEFWGVAEEWHDIGASVFVSEFQAPDPWEPIWFKNRRMAVSGTTSTKKSDALWCIPR